MTQNMGAASSVGMKKPRSSRFSSRFRRMNGYSWGAIVFIAIGFVIFAFGLAKQQGPTAALGGACVAISGTLFGLWTQSRKETIDASKFYLEAAIEGLEHAVTFLKEVENTRWISAANIFIQVREMQRGIKEDEHQAVFRMNFEVYRLQVAHALGYKKEEPWIFFGRKAEGIPDELYHAAKDSTPRKNHPAHAMEGNVANAYIPLKTLAIIVSFVRFRPDAKRSFPGEIILENKFPPEYMPRLKFLYPGLGQYLDMHENFYFVDGKIFRHMDDSEVFPHDPDFWEIANGPESDEDFAARYERMRPDEEELAYSDMIAEREIERMEEEKRVIRDMPED